MGKNPAQKLETNKIKKPATVVKKVVKPKRKKSSKNKITISTRAARSEVKAKDKSGKALKRAARPACKIKSCKRPYRARGYCGVHYRKWRHGEYGKARYRVCSDEGCRKPAVMNRHGFCEEHYQSYFIKGVAPARPVQQTPDQQAKVEDAKPADTKAATPTPAQASG